MIVPRQNFANGLLQVSEVHDHSVSEGPFDNTLHLIRMSVWYTALGVIREEMGAIDVVYDADFHAQAAA